MRMISRSALLSATAALCLMGLSAGAAFAQSVPNGGEIPQSVFLSHQDALQHLGALSKHPGKVGAVARETLALLKKHIAREKEYVMPPLTLLPYLADGKVTPDMAWAVTMADRVRADREVIFQEHVEMNTLLTELRDAGLKAKDHDAVDFATSESVDSLEDLEIQEPVVLLIGDYVKSHLAGK